MAEAYKAAHVSERKMNVDEAIQTLNADDGFPRAAMEWALAHWDEVAPRFVARLRVAASRGKVAEDAACAMFYLVHLAGERGELRAYEPLCRLIALDADIDGWLGDGSTETLPGILIRVFDGDVAPLVGAVSAPGGDVHAKVSALAALVWLVQEREAMARAELRALFADLARNPALAPHEVFWEAWASFAAHFGWADLRPEVARQNRLGALPGKAFDAREFDDILTRVRRDPSDRTELERFGARPFEDAIGTLEQWTDEEASWDDPPPVEAPYVNPNRDVGRNDPCPCGSGKKFKKCCMAG